MKLGRSFRYAGTTPIDSDVEVVRDRVHSIHAGQRLLTPEVREIAASLPQQRTPLSKRSREVNIRGNMGARRNGPRRVARKRRFTTLEPDLKGLSMTTGMAVTKIASPDMARLFGLQPTAERY